MTNITVEGTEVQVSGRNIDAQIRGIATRYKNVRQKVQECAVAIVRHAQAYGDCSRAVRLCRALPARERNSLVGWFSVVSPIGIRMGKTAAEDKCKLLNEENKRYVPFDLDLAARTMWWDDPAKANPEPKPLDTIIEFYASINKLLDRYSSDEKLEKLIREEDRDLVKRSAADIKAAINRQREAAAAAAAATNPHPGEVVEQEMPVMREVA